MLPVSSIVSRTCGPGFWQCPWPLSAPWSGSKNAWENHRFSNWHSESL